MFNEIAKVKWKGKEYECPITMELVKVMERNGANVLLTRVQIEKGGIPPVSLVAEMFAYVLQAGGCSVTESEIYESIMKDSASDDSLSMLKAADYVSSLFLPRLESADRTGGKGAKKK